MAAGKRDRRIVIETATTVLSETGHPEPSWEELLTVWAEVIPVRGEEQFLANPGQETASIDVRFRMLYFPNIGPHERIVYDGMVFDIKSIAEIGRREGLEILASAVISAVME